MVHALTVWRCYLEGTQFTVITDRCPNTYLQTQQNLSRTIGAMVRIPPTVQFQMGLLKRVRLTLQTL